MKFKTLSNYQSIKAWEKELNLLPCPIDEKNLCSDIFEDIFDGNLTYCPANSKEMTGYIRTTPVWLRYNGNVIVIRPSVGFSPVTENGLTRDNIEGRFSELFNVSDYEVTGEQDNEHLLLCYHDKNYFYIYSYWAEIKD